MRKIFPFIYFFSALLILAATPSFSKTELAVSHEPTLLVRRIFIHHHLPFLSKKILRLSSLQPGEPFREELVVESKNRITDFFENQGYSGTIVTIISSLDKKYQAMNLDIHIKRGKPSRIGKVNVAGNTVFNPHYLENKLRGSDIFRPAKLKIRVKKIQNRYVRKGYVRARARITSTKVNMDTKRVDLQLNIKEQKKLELIFKGNSWFSDSTLKNHTLFFTERGYDLYTVERSTEKLYFFYHVNGFLKTTVTPEIHKSQKTVTVIFNITEGPRTRLKKIIFKGNDHFSRKQLLKTFVNQEHTLTQQGLFDESKIPDDLKNLTQFYRDQGYLDVKILDEEVAINSFGDQATMTVQIEEGAAYRLGVITLTGNKSFSGETILPKLDFKQGKRFTAGRQAKATQNFINFFTDRGYPHADMKMLETVHSKTHTVDLALDIYEGPKVFIRSISILGNFITHEKVIREALKLKVGDPYIYKNMLSGQLALKRMGIFDYVRVTPVGLEDKGPFVDIEVAVQERKSINIDVQAGYDSDKLVSGELLLTKYNIFGSGKQVQLRAIGGFTYDRGELNFISPRIFGATWNFVHQFFVEYENTANFNDANYGITDGVFKNFGPHWALLLKDTVRRLNVFEDQSNQSQLAKNLFDSTFHEPTVSMAYDSRNNYADPQKGIYAVLTTEVDTDLANPTNNFNITKASLAHYYGFFKRFTFINNFRAGKLFRFTAGSRIPADKLFFLGGNDTLRGFNEDAVDASGGTTSLIYNAELHFKIIDQFKLAGFFDAGTLTEEIQQISRDTIRNSAGVGLRYITPVGPIRLDYGIVLDRKPGESGHRFHFSFGYFF